MDSQIQNEPLPSQKESLEIDSVVENPLTPDDTKPFFVQTPDESIGISGLITPITQSPDIERFHGKILLVMNINIGDGKKYTLPVMGDDDPLTLAQRFCKEHDLEDNVVEALSQNIYDNMEQVLQESVSCIQQSYRQSPSIQDSPFAKKSRDLLEPDQKEEQFKRFHGSDDEEPLEQIEKQESDYNDELFEKALSSNRNITPDELDLNNFEGSQNTFGRFRESPVDNHQPDNYFYQRNYQNIKTPTRQSEYDDPRRANGSKSDPRFGNYMSQQRSRTPGSMENKSKVGGQLNKKNLEIRGEMDGRNNNRQVIRERVSMTPTRTPTTRMAASPQRYSKSPNRSSVTPRKSPMNQKGPGKVVYEQVVLQKEYNNREKKPNNQSGVFKKRGSNGFMENQNSTSNILRDHSNTRNEEDVDLDNYTREILQRSKSANRSNSNLDRYFEQGGYNQGYSGGRNQAAPANVFSRLYNEHKVKEFKKEMRSQMLDEHCTFSPIINDYSSTPKRVPFEERSKKHVQKAKQMEELKKHKDTHDPKTGKPLFKPSTGRGPTGQRNQQKLPIGEYLYKRGVSQNSMNSMSREQEPRSIGDTSILQTNEKYQGVLEKGAKARLEDIFYELDSDRDGFISASQIDINPIEPQTLQVIAPVLCSMEELEQVFGKDEFISEGLRVLKGLNISERNQFIYGKSFLNANDGKGGYTFKPQINKKSAEMSKNKRPQQGDFNALYDKYMKEKALKEEKIKAEQEKKQKQELQSCSFRPSVNRKTTDKVAKKPTQGGISRQSTNTIADTSQSQQKWTVKPMEFHFD